MPINFDDIRPDEKDVFSFDFTDEIGVGTITSANITCDVSVYSVLTDPTPDARLLSAPAILGDVVSVLAGTMLDGVIYTLTASVQLNDGRALVKVGDVECALQTDDPADITLTVEKFRKQYPAFANTTDYPDEQVSLYIGLANDTANSPIDPVRWGQFYNLGLRLWVAHNLAVQRQIGLRSASGIAPGGGVLTSKSVGPVSLGYDLQFGMERDAGWYALSPYGNEFLRYLRLAGSAPIQL